MVALVGCSEEASPAPSAAVADGDAGIGLDAHVAVDVSPECPAGPSTGEAGTAPDTADGGSPLTASPIEACDGYYNGSSSAGPLSGWLHRTTAGCALGQEILLNADGTASSLRSQMTGGSWRGDRFYFQVDFADNGAGFRLTYMFERSATKE